MAAPIPDTTPSGRIDAEPRPPRIQHRLFETYPLDGLVDVDGEQLSTPYHVYDGDMFFVGGSADAAAASHLLRGEGLVPILDRAGRALMAVWLCDFTQANLGPHHELQISLFASLQPQPSVEPHPFAIYRLLTLNPQALMVCHGLWNNTRRVVRYNQAHLALDAHLCRSRLERDPAAGYCTLDFADAETGEVLVDGRLAVPMRQSPAVLWRMARHLGAGGMAQSLRAPFVHVPVANTRSAHVADNLVAHTYTRADRQMIAYYGAADRLTIYAPQYAALGFQPLFVQHNSGIRFVYLRPQKLVQPA